MLIYPILGCGRRGADGGAAHAGALMRVFLEMSVYYVLLMAVMPWLRRWVSARVCAMLWLLPDWIYVFVGRPICPRTGKCSSCMRRGRSSMCCWLFGPWARWA